MKRGGFWKRCTISNAMSRFANDLFLRQTRNVYWGAKWLLSTWLYTHTYTHIYIYIHTHNIHIKAGPPTEQVGFYTPQLTRVTIPLYLSDVHQHFATSRSPQGQPQRLTGTWGEVCSWAATWLASSEPMRASMKHLGFKGSKLGEVTGQIWTVRKKKIRIQAAN